MKQNILVADDEESIRFTFSEFLQDEGYCVKTADSLPNCVKQMQQESFDLLFLDIGFGTENGIEAILALKVLQPDCRIVIITGKPRSKSLVEAKKNGAMDYLVKPLHQASLIYNTKKILAC
jgi:two-component system NtrC family response regulator